VGVSTDVAFLLRYASSSIKIRHTLRVALDKTLN
jgi:hypothetical protein